MRYSTVTLDYLNKTYWFFSTFGVKKRGGKHDQYNCHVGFFILLGDTPSVWQDCETSNMSQAGGRRKKEIKKSGFRLRVGKKFVVKKRHSYPFPFSPTTIFLGFSKI